MLPEIWEDVTAPYLQEVNLPKNRYYQPPREPHPLWRPLDWEQTLAYSDEGFISVYTD